MKNKILKITAIVICLAALAVFFAGCVSLSEEEKEIVGQYELYEIEVAGHSYITKDTYEYFTIEFKSNKKCVVKSKTSGIEYRAEASWKIEDGELLIITKSGSATVTEKYVYNEGFFSGTNTSYVNGEPITMTVTFKRIVEDEE